MASQITETEAKTGAQIGNMLIFLYAIFILPWKLIILSMNPISKIAFWDPYPASNKAKALIFSSFSRFITLKLSINLFKLQDVDFVESVA